ncbi:MAG: N-acetylmuramoyl-L-alanine amidase, partial [Actinomycetaceae bacterium]|nr:N-acetylmuramoyl-L-alanine amidase [Actinomycetaceae bacterium]
ENTTMPSVLTEIGFISNIEEEAFITSAAGQATLARAIADALKQWHDITAKGTVSRRELRNLRFRYFDPKQQAPRQPVAQSKPETSVAKTQTDVPTTAKAEPEQQDTVALQPVVAVAVDLHEAPAEPFFSIQIFSVSRELEPSDKRFKGLRDVRLVPAPDGTYKVVHGHFVSYAETRRQLVEVRKLFPDAFVIAFDGDTQITTAEALGRKH